MKRSDPANRSCEAFLLLIAGWQSQCPWCGAHTTCHKTLGKGASPNYQPVSILRKNQQKKALPTGLIQAEKRLLYLSFLTPRGLPFELRIFFRYAIRFSYDFASCSYFFRRESLAFNSFRSLPDTCWLTILPPSLYLR